MGNGNIKVDYKDDTCHNYTGFNSFGGTVVSSNSNINTNGSRITGNRNFIKGDNNRIYGDYNTITGKNNRILGNYNIVTGENNTIEKGIENEIKTNKNSNQIIDNVNDNKKKRKITSSKKLPIIENENKKNSSDGPDKKRKLNKSTDINNISISNKNNTFIWSLQVEIDNQKLELMNVECDKHESKGKNITLEDKKHLIEFKNGKVYYDSNMINTDFIKEKTHMNWEDFLNKIKEQD